MQWKKAQKLKLELQKETRQDKTGVLKSVSTISNAKV